MTDIIVNASTSLVNINSSNISPGFNQIVLLSSVNSPGAIITIRDYAGFCSTNRKIIISTTSDTQFLDGAAISSFEIVTPFGYFTVSPRSPSIWTVLNSFAFGTQANATVSSLIVTGQIVSDRILNASTFSTSHVQTSSATVTGTLSSLREDISSLNVYGNASISSRSTINIGANLLLENSFLSTKLYVAGGYSSNANTLQASKNAIRWSTDGITFNSANTVGDYGRTESQCGSVAYGNNVYVSGWGGQYVLSTSNTSNLIQYSVDGSNWTSTIHNFSFNMYAVEFVGKMFLAGGFSATSNSRIQYSFNGQTWSNSLVVPSAFTAYGFGWNGNMYLALGTGGQGILYSVDGSNWSNTASGTNSPQIFYKAAWNGNMWVAVGGDNVTPATSIKYSTDGLNWSNAVTGGFSNTAGRYGYDVAWNGRMWVAVGLGNSAANSILYSYNGSTWSNITSGGFPLVGSLYVGRSILWNGTRWIATGFGPTNDSIQYSFDGLTWTSGSAGFLNYGDSLTYNSNTTPQLQTSQLAIAGQGEYNILNSTNTIYAGPSSMSLNGVLTVGQGNRGLARVGVNTGNPQYTLDVNGSLNTSSLFINGTNSYLVTSVSLSTNKLAVSSIVPFTAGDTAVTVEGVLRATGGLIGKSGGPLFSDWGLNIISTNTTSQGLIWGYANSSNNAADLHYFYTASNSTSNRIGMGFYDNGDIMNILASGNVGIGTTSPAYKLDVKGSCHISSGLFLDTNVSYGGLQLQNTAGTENGMFIKDPGQTGNTGWFVGESTSFAPVSTFMIGRFNAGTANPSAGLYLRSNGNVGIGTSSPTSKLTVAGGDIALDNFRELTQKNTAGTYEGFLIGRWSDNRTYLTYGSGGMDIRNSAAANTVTFTSNNRMGVGTTNPTATVHVNGTMMNTLCNSATTTATPNLVLRNAENLDVHKIFFLTAASAGNYNPMMDNNGKGIIFSDGNGPDTGGSLVIGPHSGSANGIKIMSNGRVGIGTASPSFLLDVNSDMRCVGTYVGRSGSNAASWAFNSITTATTFMAMLFGYDNSTNNAGNVSFSYSSSGSSSNRLNLGFYNNDNIMNLTAGGNVGILNTTPKSVLDINGGLFNYPVARISASDANSKTTLNNVNADCTLWPSFTTNTVYIYSREGGTNYRWTAASSSYFTGQHGNVITDSNINNSTIQNYVGFIVSSADEGYASIDKNGSTITGKDAIWITEALPKIKLTNKDKDKAVWGVLTNHENEQYNTDGTRVLDNDNTGFYSRLGDKLVRVNGLGEGAIWVTNIFGNFENGDYICSSEVPGYGRKQTDDLLHNYTVGKITMSCKFELNQSNYVCEEFEWNGKTLRKAYVGCSYHCS
jgi:hypothetical protein